jgi:2-polyprenyl-6-methoxyphenol hydroxylase-like FAD-dependent oxidoreductase
MTAAKKHTTGCCVVGGGPGGMFLALLLARQGVEVTLLEAHHDFDRDFRGDTIHPTTLELLDQLGLARELHAMPHGKLREFCLSTPEAQYRMASFARLPTRFPYIMLLPQERLLDLLARHAKRYPHLRLEMGAQAGELIREGGAVRGVVYHQDGAEHELRATLTVAADGRFSKLRKLAGLEPVRTSPPMDVVWFRLPRRDSDPHDQGLTVGHAGFVVLLERPGEWQVGFVIPKGGYQELRKQGLEAFQRAVAAVVPWLGDRVGQLSDWQKMTLLSVESSRLRKWYLPGLLLIGDAAHVMSPVGGVGINYAIQDAVAAANLLAEPLLRGEVHVGDLAAVQRRREWPVRMIQAVQGFLQRNIVAKALDRGKPFQPPLPMRVLLRIPLLRDLPGRVIGLGFGRERARAPGPGV